MSWFTEISFLVWWKYDFFWLPFWDMILMDRPLLEEQSLPASVQKWYPVCVSGSVCRDRKQRGLVLKTFLCGKFSMLMSDLHHVCAMSTLSAQSFCRISFWCPRPGWALLLQDHNTSSDAEWPPPLQTLYFPGLFWSDVEFHGNSGLCHWLAAYTLRFAPTLIQWPSLQ